MSFGMVCVSALCMMFVCATAAAARWLVEKAVRRPFVKFLFQEAIAAAELCGCCFELIIVADNFGVSTYAVFLFVLTMYWSASWGSATACPYTHLEDVMEGRTDVRDAALIVWAELAGGAAVFKWVRTVWSWELVETHEDRAFEECSADLQVSVIYGALIEGVGTCVYRVASRALSDSGFKLAPAVDAFIATALVVAAFDYSGGYYNPVLASALKFGCAGNNFIEHVLVYWVGACAGAALSTHIYMMPQVQKLVQQAKAKLE